MFTNIVHFRLYLDQYGGLELDNTGSKKKKWSWKDQETHVHAPPFQPICFGINKNLAVRVMSQENISVTFSAKQRSCKFNVGKQINLVIIKVSLNQMKRYLFIVLLLLKFV